jgi:uncharacterized membrane protein
MNRRTLLAVAMFALSVAVVTGSGSFTSASAERSVSVDVVEDERAFVGIERAGPEVPNGNHEVVLMYVTNRFHSKAESISVVAVGEPSGPPPVVQELTHPSKIQAGEKIPVRAKVTCGNATTGGEILVRLNVTTDGATVEMTRSVTIECTGAPPANESSEPTTTTTDSSANTTSENSSTATPSGGS